MSEPEAPPPPRKRRWIGALLVLVLFAAGLWAFFDFRETWPRGEALTAALGPVIEKGAADQSLVARAILDNYRETRKNASRWSGIYWGFNFLAAALSALAALILKLESLLNQEKLKKDLAALFSVAAALLVTISTSGDFQRKWQANRVAAAELEREGYQLLEEDAVNPRTHLASVGKILLQRHLAIVGGSERAELKDGAGEEKPKKPPGAEAEDSQVKKP